MMTNEATSEKLNMEPEKRILFGDGETIRMFVKAKYEKGFLASTLALYPINATNGMKPVCSFYTTAGRKFSLKSQGHSIRYLEGRGGMKMSLTSRRSKGYHQYFTTNIQDDDIFLIEVQRTYPYKESPFPEAQYEIISMRQMNDSLDDQIEYMLEYCRIRKVFAMPNVYIDKGVQAWGNSITPNGYGDAGKTFGQVHVGHNRMMRNRVFKYDYTGILRYSNAYHCFDLFVGPELANDEKLYEYLANFVVPRRDRNVWGITKDAFTDSWMDYPPSSYPDVRCTVSWKGEWKTWK